MNKPFGDRLLEFLRDNPHATPQDITMLLPAKPEDVQAWLDDFLGESLPLDPKEPFLEQTLTLAQEVDTPHSLEVWDLYDGEEPDEDYLDTVWHVIQDVDQDGVAVAGAKDRLGAILARMTQWEVDEQLAETFRNLADDDWTPPLSPDEMDKKLACQVSEKLRRMSPEARARLLAEELLKHDKGEEYQ